MRWMRNNWRWLSYECAMTLRILWDYLFYWYSTKITFKQIVYCWSRGQYLFNDMTDFEKTEVSGHTAAMGHTWALGNAQDHRDKDSDLGHGVCIHIYFCYTQQFSSQKILNVDFWKIKDTNFSEFLGKSQLAKLISQIWEVLLLFSLSVFMISVFRYCAFNVVLLNSINQYLNHNLYNNPPKC